MFIRSYDFLVAGVISSYFDIIELFLQLIVEIIENTIKTGVVLNENLILNLVKAEKLNGWDEVVEEIPLSWAYIKTEPTLGSIFWAIDTWNAWWERFGFFFLQPFWVLVVVTVIFGMLITLRGVKMVEAILTFISLPINPMYSMLINTIITIAFTTWAGIMLFTFDFSKVWGAIVDGYMRIWKIQIWASVYWQMII